MDPVSTHPRKDSKGWILNVSSYGQGGPVKDTSRGSVRLVQNGAPEKRCRESLVNEPRVETRQRWTGFIEPSLSVPRGRRVPSCDECESRDSPLCHCSVRVRGYGRRGVAGEGGMLRRWSRSVTRH